MPGKLNTLLRLILKIFNLLKHIIRVNFGPKPPKILEDPFYDNPADSLKDLLASLSPFNRRAKKKARQKKEKEARLRQAEKRIEKLKYRLFNLGFEERAEKDLYRIATGDKNSYAARLAARALALYYTGEESEAGAQQALEMLEIAAREKPGTVQARRDAIMKAECYALLGDKPAGRQVIEEALLKGADVDLYLAAANFEEGAEDRLPWFNRALELHHLAPVSLKPPPASRGAGKAEAERSATEPAPLDKLSVTGGNHKHRGQAADGEVKVTVILTVYNAEKEVPTALRSLLAQTWSNLEVLVVDDCSTDSTAEVIAGFAAKDNRVRLIRTQTNSGPYIARNLALKEATGDFVTCHDGDDWSHPEKIAVQAKHLQDNPQVIGNTSEQCRVTPELKVHRRGRYGRYSFRNTSSFMFRREKLTKNLGFWDCVRFGADDEMIRRVRKVFGYRAFADLKTGPLSFVRQHAGSLTGSKAFGYAGYHTGIRREYLESLSYHHETAENLYYDFPLEKRPFPVPEPMLPKGEEKLFNKRHFDLIIATDLRQPGSLAASTADEIKALKQLNLRAGLVQLSDYQLDPELQTAPQYRELIDGDRVQVIVHGEEVSCDLLIVKHPPVLNERQQYIPKVAAEQVLVVATKAPGGGSGDALNKKEAYHPERCRKMLREYFGKEGTWYPADPLVREAFSRDYAEQIEKLNLAETDWPQVIDTAAFKLPQRSGSRKKPVAGRHGKDSPENWPADPETLLSIYPSSGEFKVLILGGAKVPKAMLGRLPESWHVIECGALSPLKFLSRLDFFVYYPHPSRADDGLRVILEAMAAGVPVILPLHYRAAFGDAAYYAKKDEVAGAIRELSRDPVKYRALAESGRRFVEENLSFAVFTAKILGLLESAEKQREASEAVSGKAEELAHRLFSHSFTEKAVYELQELAQKSKKALEAEKAARVLARFYTNQRDRQSLQKGLLMLKEVGSRETNRRHLCSAAIAAAECYFRLGNRDGAKSLIESALANIALAEKSQAVLAKKIRQEWPQNQAISKEGTGDKSLDNQLSNLVAAGGYPGRMAEISARLLLAGANYEAELSKRVSLINRALSYYGLLPLALEPGMEEPGMEEASEPQKTLLEHLTAGEFFDHPRELRGGEVPLVTVIVAACKEEKDPGKVLGRTLKSLSLQSWPRLEVLVAIEGSGSEIASLVERYRCEQQIIGESSTPGTQAAHTEVRKSTGAPEDMAVRLVETDAKGCGKYAAINRALPEAGGSFISIIEAGSFAHPQRIEQQAKHLTENEEIIMNLAEHACVTENLFFDRQNTLGEIIFSDYDAVMFRREAVLEHLGAFDSVRFGAGEEFIQRAEIVFGPEAVARLQSGPLTFSEVLTEPASEALVPYHYGYDLGALREYKDSYTYYHAKVSEGEANVKKHASGLKYESPLQKRPFPVPKPLLPHSREKQGERDHYDVIIASDYRFPGGTSASNAEEIKAQNKLGLQSALIKLSRYDLNSRHPVNHKIRELIDGEQVNLVVYGEKVSCETLIVKHPPVLQERQLFIPDVAAEKIKVIINQTPQSDYGPDPRILYNFKDCSERLQEYFGKKGTWHPIGPLIRSTLHHYHKEDLKWVHLAERDWVEIIDVDEWRREKRPPRRERIRIGRHSREDYFKWPADPQELLAAYPASDRFAVRILGGADTPAKTLGRLPDNWQVLPFGSVHPQQFLAELDVFVYFPHPDLVEAFGRTIIEAMAVGVPVILPPKFKDLFGEAALYCEPQEVVAVIDSLMADDAFYETQVEKAQHYVAQNFGYLEHAKRLKA